MWCGAYGPGTCQLLVLGFPISDRVFKSVQLQCDRHSQSAHQQKLKAVCPGQIAKSEEKPEKPPTLQQISQQIRIAYQK